MTTFSDPGPSDQPAEPTPDIHKQAYDFEPMWKGKPLEGFTMARQALVGELMSRRTGVGDHDAALNEAYMPEIWAVLWLCTHVPADWRALRMKPAEWWEVIEEWAETECPRELWVDATMLVWGQRPTKLQPDLPVILGLWSAVRANIVEIKPSGPESPGSGNAVSQ